MSPDARYSCVGVFFEVIVHLYTELPGFVYVNICQHLLSDDFAIVRVAFSYKYKHDLCDCVILEQCVPVFF